MVACKPWGLTCPPKHSVTIRNLELPVGEVGPIAAGTRSRPSQSHYRGAELAAELHGFDYMGLPVSQSMGETRSHSGDDGGWK